jgi:serine/threonine protein kinase
MTAPEAEILQRLLNIPQFSVLSDNLKNLILSCLRTNPCERISACTALRHPWFEDFRRIKLQEEGKLVDLNDLKSMSVYGQTPYLKKLTLMFLGARCNRLHLKQL